MPDKDFKKQALALWDIYFQDRNSYRHHESGNHLEDRQNLIEQLKFCRTLKNLAHFFSQDAFVNLASEMESTYTACLQKKVAHCYRNSATIEIAYLHVKRLLEEWNGNATAILPETLDIIRTLKGLQDVRDEAESEHASKFANEFLVVIQPSEKVFQSGLDLIAILDEIGKLGHADVMPFADNVPELDSLDPEKCYVGWEVHLFTDADINALKDVLIFLEYDEGCILGIQQLKATETAAPELPPEEIEVEKAVVEKQTTDTGKKLPDVTESHKDETLSTIRVPAGKLDRIVDLVGEIVTAQSRLNQITGMLNSSELTLVSEEFERLTDELRSHSIGLRMLPASVLFKRFNRLVRDLSSDLHKNVELIFEGEETELDKSVIESIYDPLVHLVRNSIDHGLESPEERIKKGKKETGRIVLASFQSGPEVFIQVRDDGGGVSLGRIRSKALEKGLIQPEEILTEKQVMQLIFLPGFSTAENISSVSGRGVGMDVVKRNVEALRGSVDIESKPGEGTTVTLKFPLTLAIIEGLMVEVGGDLFILPLSVVEECLNFDSSQISDAKKMINLRGSAVPYVLLKDLFEMKRDKTESEIVVVIRDENEGRVGLVVNAIVGQHQTVIKPLGNLYKDRPEFSGATILGDGSVALILNTARLVKTALAEM